MPYYSDNWTDKELEALERRIAQVYREAEKDLDREVKEYFAKFKLRDKEMQALCDAGEITKAELQQWRLTQIGRGKRFEALRDKIAERYTKANETATGYVNDLTPSIYSLNRNYEAYTIEKAVGSCDFTMWDESTVRRLIVQEPDLMPYYPPARALQRGIDLEYGKQQITKHITSGIIRGLPPGKIANELMANMSTMSRESAVRAARTGITAAQNAGRMDSYVAAEKMGIKIRRRWICTKDSRTRLSHGLADGQIVVGTKAPFVVGGYKMMFPGDKSLGAPGHEIYNCRCTTRTVEKDGIEAEPREMRVRNPQTGEWELVHDMTYSDWMQWKKTGVKPEPPKPTKPKKEYLTEKKLKEKISSIDSKMAKLDPKSEKWRELKAQKDEYQTKLDAKANAKQKKAIVKKQNDIQKQIDSIEANLQTYTFPSKGNGTKWTNITAKDYESLKNDIPKKIKYFETVGNNPAFVQQLKTLEADGKRLSDLYAELQKTKFDLAKLGKKKATNKHDILNTALKFNTGGEAVKYHEAHNFSRDIWEKVFTDDERRGIKAYTGSYYRRMNKHLRLGESVDSDILKYIKDCTSALNKTKVAEDVVVYRGMGTQKSVATLFGLTEQQLSAIIQADASQLIGTRVVEKGFASTAVTFDSAWRGCKLDIYLPAGSSAMYVDPVSTHSGELEMLLQRNSAFEVQNIEVNSVGEITKMVLILLDQTI